MTEELRDVIAERWRAQERTDERLRHALRAAATEARDRGLRPEELILILKGIEAEVFENNAAGRALNRDVRRRVREFLVTACLDAYFGEQP